MSRITFGVDHAIAGQDRTYVSVYDVEHKQFIGEEGFYSTSFNQFRDRIASMSDIYHPSIILMDINSSGMVVLEALQAEGFPVRGYAMTRRGKEMLKETLLESLKTGEAKSPWKVELRDDRLGDSWVAMALALYAANHYGRVKVDFA